MRVDDFLVCICLCLCSRKSLATYHQMLTITPHLVEITEAAPTGTAIVGSTNSLGVAQASASAFSGGSGGGREGSTSGAVRRFGIGMDGWDIGVWGVGMGVVLGVLGWF